MYEIGGLDNGGSTQATVYYASLSRLKVGAANLDLVGLQGQNLADDTGSSGQGSTGGTVTAGNGTFVGALQVQGEATIAGDTSVNGTLAGNTATFRNTTNSTTAFQIQDTSAANLLTADTTTDTVTVVNTAVSGTLTVTSTASLNGGVVLASGQTVKFAGIGNAQNVVSKSFTCTAAVNAGDIVVIDTANAGQVTTLAANDSPLVAGVAVASASAGATCQVATLGTIQVNIDTSAVNVGDLIATSSNAAGQGKTAAGTATGTVLGKALSAKAGGSTGAVWVLMAGR
jgi:hypothetical protein